MTTKVVPLLVLCLFTLAVARNDSRQLVHPTNHPMPAKIDKFDKGDKTTKIDRDHRVPADRCVLEKALQDIAAKVVKLDPRKPDSSSIEIIHTKKIISEQNLQEKLFSTKSNVFESIYYDEENGTPAFLPFTKTDLKSNSTKLPALEQHAKLLLQNNATRLYLADPTSELVLISGKKDEAGHTHLRYQQQYNGIKIWASDLYLHYSPEGQAELLNGRYFPTPDNLSVVFNLTKDQAVSIAADVLKFDLSSAHVWECEKIIYPTQKGDMRPAWFVSIGSTLFEDYYIFVDAVSGVVLYHYNNVQIGTPAKGSGIDMFGRTQDLDIYKVNDSFYLANTTKNMFSGIMADNLSDLEGSIMVWDARNVDPEKLEYYYYVSSPNQNSWPANAVSAAATFSKVYDYFKSVHNLSSLDNQRQNIIGIINYGIQYNNAFWTGGAKLFCFGNGDNQMMDDAAGAFDVMAHEYGHGITQFNSNLEYQFQSGALNEAFSDYVGVMAEFYADPQNANWLFGEYWAAENSGYSCVRDLTNPHNPRSMTSDYPSKMSEFADWPIDQDNGGVHRNSTIPGHAFYQMSTLMSRDKVEKIVYRAYIHYLTRRSQFVDLRLAAIQAAQDLYPGQNIDTLVKQAFDRVEIYGDEKTEPEKPFEPVVGNDYVLCLLEETGQIASIKSDIPYEDGNAAFFDLYSSSKPSITEDGTTIAYIDFDGNVNWFDIPSATNYVLSEDGGWYNIAISPKADYIALTPDPEESPGVIGILNTETGATKIHELYIPTTGMEGNEITPEYADILDWSIEGGWLIYDCLYAISDQYGYEDYTWGIYLTNANEDVVLALFQPDFNYAVGNPSFSSTRDNVIAFDIADYSNDVYNPDYYVMTYDLFSGILGTIHEKQQAFGHPSFSPDDKRIVFQNVSEDDQTYLLQAQMQNDGLNANPATVQDWIYPVQYPVWYAVGARPSNSVQMQNPGIPKSIALTNYPNPFNAGTTISYYLPLDCFVTINIFNMNGQRIDTLVDEFKTAGHYDLHWNTSLFSSGIYLAQIETSEKRYSTKLMLIK